MKEDFRDPYKDVTKGSLPKVGTDEAVAGQASTRIRRSTMKLENELMAEKKTDTTVLRR